MWKQQLCAMSSPFSLLCFYYISCVLSKLKAADAAVYCANLLCHTYLVTGELHCQTTALCSRVLSKNRFVCIATRRTNSTISKMKYYHIAALHYHFFFMQKWNSSFTGGCIADLFGAKTIDCSGLDFALELTISVLIPGTCSV